MGEWKISGRMENIWFSLVCLVGGGVKVGGWKTFLFGWREKWEDGKYSLYKLTIISCYIIVGLWESEKGR